MELQLEYPSWVRVALAIFPPITVRVRMEGLVGISLGLPFGILHVLLKLWDKIVIDSTQMKIS